MEIQRRTELRRTFSGGLLPWSMAMAGQRPPSSSSLSPSLAGSPTIDEDGSSAAVSLVTGSPPVFAVSSPSHVRRRQAAQPPQVFASSVSSCGGSVVVVRSCSRSA
nr:hypothetical protein Itr_chr03CG23920 [Ipomoea trifida]